MLVWTPQGFSALPGPVYTAVGSAVTLTGGLGLGQSAAFIISNPAGSNVRVVPIKIAAANTGVPSTILGFAKTLLGTASLVGAGANAGGVIALAGGGGTATGKAQIFGTATLLNGTAGPCQNGWCIVEVAGAQGTNLGMQTYDMSGAVSINPGENGMVYSSAASAGCVPMIMWMEIPLQPGY